MRLPEAPSLHDLGWNEHFAREMARLDEGLLPARVAAEDRGLYHVLGPGVPEGAVLSGRLAHAATSRLDLPAVGDWVAVRAHGAGGPALVLHVLSRLTRFVRQAPGRRTEARVVAANLDTVAVVTSADADLNAARLQRYLSVVEMGGALPLVVLSKADAAEDLAAAEAIVHKAAPRVAVAVTSGLDGRGVEGLRRRVLPGQTLAFVGSSGVGKSTLVNALLGEERQATLPVRGRDGRGRHATTRRELFALPGGGLLVDTPGLRELALWAEAGADSAGAGADSAGGDIRELARACRFRDCRHETEPGCAVLDAIEEGALDDERLRGHRKLEREMAFQARRQEVGLLVAERRRWKQLTAAYKKRPPKGSL